MAHAAIRIILRPRTNIILRAQAEHGAQSIFEFFGSSGEQSEGRAQRSRQFIVRLLNAFPARSLAARIVVDCDEKFSVGFYGQCSVFERQPHLPRVVQNAPRVNDIKLSKRFYVVRVKGRGFINRPVRVCRRRISGRSQTSRRALPNVAPPN